MVMRNVLAMFACLGLTGCILPPAITYVTMALDGVSYVATGKSVGDHALSAAVEKDCAVWRVVSEQGVDAVCHEYVDDDAEDDIAVALEAGDGGAALPTERRSVRQSQPADIVLAAAAPTEPLVILAVALTPEPTESAAEIDTTAPPEPIDLLLGIGPAKLSDDPTFHIEPAATDNAPAANNRKAVFLVVGSFRTIDRAERLAAQIPGITTTIAPALVGSDRYYRVVVGPYEPGETGDAQSRLAAAGIGNTWAANLCTGDLGTPPCDTSP